MRCAKVQAESPSTTGEHKQAAALYGRLKEEHTKTHDSVEFKLNGPRYVTFQAEDSSECKPFVVKLSLDNIGKGRTKKILNFMKVGGLIVVWVIVGAHAFRLTIYYRLIV
jgi:hypothetical protein